MDVSIEDSGEVSGRVSSEVTLRKEWVRRGRPDSDSEGYTRGCRDTSVLVFSRTTEHNLVQYRQSERLDHRGVDQKKSKHRYVSSHKSWELLAVSSNVTYLLTHSKSKDFRPSMFQR